MKTNLFGIDGKRYLLPLLIQLGSIRAAHATPKVKSIRVVAPANACPTEADVIAEVAKLLPNFAIFDGKSGKSTADFEVRIKELGDLGTTYRVWIGKSGRQFRDETHNCKERSRQAAVFLAMSLDVAEPPSSDAPAIGTTSPSAAPADALVGPTDTVPTAPCDAHGHPGDAKVEPET